MNKENNIEMSTLDDLIPRYYKGFDMDILLQKIFDRKLLTEEERKIASEAQDIYYKKHFEENQKRWDDWKKAHPGKYTKSIHPQRLINGKI